MANEQFQNDDNKETRIFSAEGKENGLNKPIPEQNATSMRRIRNVPLRMQTPDYLKAVLMILIVMTVAAVITAFAIGVFYKPSVSTDVPFDTSTSEPDTDPESPITEPVDPPLVFTRNTDCVNLLVMGKDRAAYNTDVIMIVNFNTKTHVVNVLQIPRDTYIEHETWSGRVNALYAHYVYLSPDEYSAKKQREYAMQKTAETLEASLCINIDYYALVNLEVLRDVVDGMGGVWIDIPFDMYYVDDTPDVGITVDLKAGYQRLNGAQAEQFVRFRDGYLLADISRMDAQKMFISALLTQLKSSLSVNVAINIARSVFDNITTDIQFDEAQYYVKELFNLELSNVTLITAAGEGCRVGVNGAWMYVLSRGALLDVVNKYLNVYNEDIPDEIFDAGKRLVLEEDEDMVLIYDSDRTYTAVGADKTGEIYIPHEE